LTIEEADPIEEAESLDYEDEVEKPPKKSRDKEEDKLFGLPIPKKEGMIGLVAVVALVIVLMIASLVVESFGIVPGAKAVKVFIPAGEGIESYAPVGTSLPFKQQSSNTGINDVDIRITSPAFGKAQSGDADVKLIYEGETLYKGKSKVTNNKGSFSINYRDIYVDNGEYEVKVSFKGKSGSDKVTIERTAKKVYFYQYRLGEGDRFTNLSFKFDLMPSDDSTKNDRSIFTWGHGDIKVYYVSEDNEADKNNQNNWELMEIISFEVSPLSFNYTLQYNGQRFENTAGDANFSATYIFTLHRDYIDRDNDGENEDGYYTSTIDFYNDFGNDDHNDFDDAAKTAYAEESGNREWSFLAKDDDPDD